MREVRVLEVITTPMRRDGLTLAPLRLAGWMTRVRCDFAASFVADDGIRDAVEAAAGSCSSRRAACAGRFATFRIPRAPDSGETAMRSSTPTAIPARWPSTCSLRSSAARGCASRTATIPPAATGCLHRLLRPLFDHLYTHAMACGTEAGRWLFSEPAVRDRPKSRRFARVRVRSRRARIGARRARAGAGRWPLGCVAGLRAREEPRVSARCLRPRAEAVRPDCPARAGGRWPASR